MALADATQFNHWLGGRPLASRMVVYTGDYDHFLGGLPLWLLAGIAVVYQAVAPIADVTDGTWLNESSSNVNLYASIDETVANDADYIQSVSAPAADTTEQLLAGAGTPGVGTVSLTIRHRVT